MTPILCKKGDMEMSEMWRWGSLHRKAHTPARASASPPQRTIHNALPRAKRAFTSHFSLLTSILLALLAASIPAAAQDATGFLGVTGIVTREGAPQTGYVVQIENESTRRTAATTTPSSPLGRSGSYFLSLVDYSANRAAQTGDILRVRLWDEQGERVPSVPASLTVTPGDITQGLRIADLSVDSRSDTPPEVTLSFDPSTAVVNPEGTLRIDATFSEAIDTSSTVNVAITPPSTTTPLTGTMIRVNETSYTFTFTAPAGDEGLGEYSIAVTGAKDSDGNENTAPRDSVFNVAPAASVVTFSIGNAPGPQRGEAEVPILLLNPEDEDVAASQFRVAYSTGTLSFTEAVAGPAAQESGYQVSALEDSPGDISLVVFGLTDVPLAAGVVVELKFGVASGAPLGTTTLTGSDLVVSTLSATTVQDAVITGGGITVEEGAGGGTDVNGDGTTNVLDLQAVVNAILAPGSSSNNTDVDGNGSTNVLDLQAVVNAILGG